MRKHPLAECENCPLQFNGKYVPTRGPDKAEIAIVGEAPGYYEAEQGTPFVGPSGRLLNAVLQHHKIDRNKVVVTNACACRPPDNETPTEAAIVSCRPRLLFELQERSVGNVLALGNTAAKSLLHEDGITRLRIGRGRVCADAPEIRVTPTLHPAAILRVPDNILFLTTDVGKLLTETPKWEPPTYAVVDDEATALSYIAQLRERRPPKIAVDVETHFDKDDSFEQPQQSGLLCVGVAYAHKKVVVFGEQACNYPTVMKALAEFINETSKVIFHNGKFDQKALFLHCGMLRMTDDTMLKSYTLNEYGGVHSLDYIGQELVGAPNWKGMLKRYNPKKNGYGVIPRPVLYQYNAYDCDVTFEADDVLDKMMEAVGSELHKLHAFLIEASNELVFLELNGIGINQEYLADLAGEYALDITRIETEIDSLLPVIGDEPRRYEKSKKRTGLVNPASPMQVTEVLKDFGIVVNTTDEAMCKIIIERRGADSPVGLFLTKLLEFRGVAKEKGTYVDGIQKRLYEGRIYSNFLLHRTTTGRLSSRNPNLQNIPRRQSIKRIFVPVKAGNVFVQADYGQAELRILCWLASDRYFTPIFNDDELDVFDELTPRLLPHLPPKDQIPKAEWKEVRSKRVKPFVYGLSYGRTEYGLAGDPELQMTVAEARAIMQNFMGLIPEVVEWQKRIKKDVENGIDLVSPFGRHRRFPLITDDNHDDSIREALSFLPQSTSSDVCLRAAVRVRRDLRGIAWLRNIVHDSILVECSESRVEEVRNVLEHRMIESGIELVGDYVKFKVDIGVGDSWGAFL